MLSKHRRVTKSLFDTVLKEGKTLHGNLLYLRYISKSLDKYSHFAFVAPKSVAKLAVNRNSLRRKGYSAIHPLSTSNSVGVFFYKKEAKNASSMDISNDVVVLLKKANLLL